MNDVFAGLQIVKVGETRALPDRRVRAVVRLVFREDPVGFRDDDESGDLEAAGEVVKLEDECTALCGCGKMLVEAFAGGVEELGMMGFVRAEFGEARERRGLEIVGWRFFGRRVAGVDDGER